MFDFKSVIEECAHIAETEPKYPGLTLDRAGKIYKMALDLGRNDRSHEAAIQLIIRSTCEDTCRAIAERIRETKKDTWQSMETAPRGKSVLLKTFTGLMYCGQYRKGNEYGEPQPEVLAWRCDSSGRFTDPIAWMNLPEN